MPPCLSRDLKLFKAVIKIYIQIGAKNWVKNMDLFFFFFFSTGKGAIFVLLQK